jgi:hypothetical protein
MSSEGRARFRLAALRIPSGWQVVFNNLVELPPMETLTAEDRDSYLSQDLLQLRSTARAGSSAGYTIDVGWRPDGDATGAYRLRVVRESWDDVVIKLDTPDLAAICRAIDTCTWRLAEGVSPEMIQVEVRVAND